MDKLEFEKRFMKIAKDKFDTRASWDNALCDLLKFIDDHKIYEYKSYERLLQCLRDVNFEPNASLYLENLNAGGCFTIDTKLLLLREKHHKRQNYPSTFIHELIHALSFDQKEFFDCQNFKKQTTPLISAGVYLSASNPEEPHNDFTDDEMVEILRWKKRHDNIFADAKTSRPIRAEMYTGFFFNEIEYSEFINQRKIGESVKTIRDMLRFDVCNLKDTSFTATLTKANNLTGLNEGTTELISNLIACYCAPDKTKMLKAYSTQVKICSQLYAIFGETLFEGFWTHSLSPMCKKLQISEDTLESIVAPMSDIHFSQNDHDCEKNMQIADDIQIDLLKLFERKMLRELAKYKDDFNSPQDMRDSILSSFFDYSKLLHFGIEWEEILNPNFQGVWDQFESSIKNCMTFGNKLLARRKMNQVIPFRSDSMEVFKNQNYFTYAYISKDLDEITLSNRLTSFDFDYEGPSDERREKDSMKTFKAEGAVGFYSFALNKGVDQIALYCDAMGEEVDENLLKIKDLDE